MLGPTSFRFQMSEAAVRSRQLSALSQMPGSHARAEFRPGKDVEDILLSGVRQPVAKHQLAVLAAFAARRRQRTTERFIVGLSTWGANALS
jgi:hypothetical protein